MYINKTKVLITVLYILLIALCFMTGCSKKESSQELNYDQYLDKRDAFVKSYIKEHSATDYSDTAYSNMFCAEIIDEHLEDNIYDEFSQIEEIYYEDNDLYMCSQLSNNDRGILKISKEQYEYIQTTLRKEGNYNDFHMIFQISSIKPMFPSIDAHVSVSVNQDGENEYDEYTDLSLDSRIIYGTLIDIVVLNDSEYQLQK